jgi:signal transduction histidine kinase
MAARMREYDWSTTDFGPPQGWPENLRVAVRLCLTSRFPILLWWGPRLALLYNDAYLPWLSEAKHPRALGRPGHECWSEVWDVLGPMLESVISTKQATWSVDVELFFERNVRKEEVYITWSFTPILSPDGETVDGIFCPCFESTQKVIGARRLETLRRLGTRPFEARTVDAVCRESAAVLAENTRDVPFAAIYAVSPNGDDARLSASAVPSGEHRLPDFVSASTDDSRSPWPLGGVLRTGYSLVCGPLPAKGIRLPSAPWPEPVENAVALPIHAALHQLVGILVLGASARRPFDEGYRAFFDLVAAHVATAIFDAQDVTERKQVEKERTRLLGRLITAQEEERRRIAREMHDQFGQQLSALKLRVGGLKRKYLGHETLGDEINELEAIASQLDRDVEFVVWKIRPTALDDLGLVDALMQFVKSWSKQYDVDAEMHSSGIEEDRLPNEIETVLYRVAQEALTNIAKHARARNVSVLLERHGGHVSLIVEDNGVGFDQDRVVDTQPKGLGLIGMRERVEYVRGTCDVEAHVGDGVTIAVRIPIPLVDR